MNKFEHVRQATQTRPHTCHWPGCKLQVPPARWGCSKHWFTLPKHLRDKVWQTYQAGQEETMSPSQKYLDVMCEVDRWIREEWKFK